MQAGGPIQGKDFASFMIDVDRHCDLVVQNKSSISILANQIFSSMPINQAVEMRLTGAPFDLNQNTLQLSSDLHKIQIIKKTLSNERDLDKADLVIDRLRQLISESHRVIDWVKERLPSNQSAIELSSEPPFAIEPLDLPIEESPMDLSSQS